MREGNGSSGRGSGPSGPRSAAGLPPLPPQQQQAPPARQRGKKARPRVTRGRSLGEVLADLERIHAERTARVDALQAEQQAIQTRDHIARTWVCTLEALIEVTAPLRRAQAAAAQRRAGVGAPAAPPPSPGGPSPGDFAVREAFLMECLAHVRALRLGTQGDLAWPCAAAIAASRGGARGGSRHSGRGRGQPPQPLHKQQQQAGSSGGGGGGAGVAGQTVPGWIERFQAMCSEGGGVDAVVQSRMGSAPDAFARCIRDFVQASVVDLCHVRCGNPIAPEAAVRLKQSVDSLMAECAVELIVNPVAVFQATVMRLDTLKPLDAPLPVEHWIPAFNEMRLEGQQEAEVLELFSQWGPATAACIARRTALAAEHGRRAAAAGAAVGDIAALEVEENLLEDLERAQLEFHYKAAAFVFALWTELLAPEQVAGCLITAYPYAPSLLALDAAARIAVAARRSKPPVDDGRPSDPGGMFPDEDVST